MFYRSIFISHSWAYSGHYETLAKWIFEDSWNFQGTPIAFRNTSVPRDNPIHEAPNVAELQRQIYARIVGSDIVVCPTGMYSSHSRWIARELDGAQLHRKPLLAVNPWGQQRSSTVVKERANRTVGWNKQSIIDAIWQLTNA